MIIITCRSCVFFFFFFSLGRLSQPSLSSRASSAHTHTLTRVGVILLYLSLMSAEAPARKKKMFHDGAPALEGAEPNRRGGGHGPADRCRPRTSRRPSAWRQSTTAHRPRAHTLFTDDVRARHTVDRRRISYESDYELFSFFTHKIYLNIVVKSDFFLSLPLLRHRRQLLQSVTK